MILVSEAGWRLASALVSWRTLPELPSMTISAYGAARDGWLAKAKMTATSPHTPQRSPPGAPVPIPSMNIPRRSPGASAGPRAVLYPQSDSIGGAKKGAFLKVFRPFWLYPLHSQQFSGFTSRSVLAEATRLHLQKCKAARTLLHCKKNLDFFVQCNISWLRAVHWPVGAERRTPQNSARCRER